MWSVAEHGPTAILVNQLRPLLEKYNVTAYLCGHDHSEQYINTGSGIDYHVMGAAHVTDSSTAHASAVPTVSDMPGDMSARFCLM